ncbi:hypothetical protein ACHAWF_016025 [Thalassiosira exigua]
MFPENFVDEKDGQSYRSTARGDSQQSRTGFAPRSQELSVGPPMHPLAQRQKRAKTNEYGSFGSNQASSAEYQLATTGSTPTFGPLISQILPSPAMARSGAAARRSVPTQNPYSTSRGLRHFSMKVCEKVEEKGTTTYNEVADELVRELKQAEEAINAAAAARGEVPIKKKRKSSGKTKKNHDDKNIRRRVYDALNVLMAMDIITKDKKEITWRGLPGSRVHEGSRSNGNSPGKRRDGLSRRQRVQQLKEDVSKRQGDIRKKRECLQELMVQNVCFQNLLGRNHAREVEDQRRVSSSGGALTGERKREQVKLADECEVKEIKDEKIPLPFLIVSTDSRAVVQCEMCPERTNVSFDFNLPFEINDDNEILKRLGMSHASKEALQRSLPPDLFHYCNTKGLLKNIAR